MELKFISCIFVLDILSFEIAGCESRHDNLDSSLIKSPELIISEDERILNRLDDPYGLLPSITEMQNGVQLPIDGVSKRLRRDLSAKAEHRETTSDPCSSRWNAVIETDQHLSDTSDFCKLLLYNDLFVDKTLLIPEIVDCIITSLIMKRPRGWGKTVNMDMLKRFLEIELDSEGHALPLDRSVNRKLFLGGKIELPGNNWKQLHALKITQQEYFVHRHQGQYPVIYVSFKNIIGETYQQIEDGTRKVISDLFRKYDFLSTELKEETEKEKFSSYLDGTANATELENSLYFLTELLYTRFNKSVYVLVDDYDSPMNHFYLRRSDEFAYQRQSFQTSEEFQKLLNLFDGIYSQSLRSNDYRKLKHGMVTMYAMTNLFYYCSFDEGMTPFYGFDQAEVDELLTRVSFEVDAKKLKNWYYGYKFSDTHVLYKPLSIIRCLSNGGKFDHYLLNDQNVLIDTKMLTDWFQPVIQNLIAGNNVSAVITEVDTFDYVNSHDRAVNMLLFFGLLNPVCEKGNQAVLSVCNEETRYFLELKFEEYLDNKLRVGDENELVSLLLNFQIEKFRNKLDRDMAIHVNVTNSKGNESEQFFNVVLRSFLKSPDCKIYNTQTGGLKKILIIEPASKKYNNAAIIAIETAEYEEDIARKLNIGLEEINDRKYYHRLRKNRAIRKILKICVTFIDLNPSIDFQIEEFSF